MPTVGVHIIAKNERGQFLLVRRNYLDKDWIPPGGMMEDNESIPDAAIRECLEETGYLIEPVELVALGSRPKTNDVIVVLEGKIIKKQKVDIDPEEISEFGFFALNDLPSPMKPETKKLLELYSKGDRGKILVV
jgi:8-oxo-dGTP diphosphatase